MRIFIIIMVLHLAEVYKVPEPSIIMAFGLICACILAFTQDIRELGIK